MRETFAEYTARLLALAVGAEPLDIMASTASAIGHLIAGRSTTELQRRPSADRWSIAEIVSHLADSEIVFAFRLRQILSAAGGPIQAFDQNAWVDSQQAASSDAFASLSLFAALRGANLLLVRRLTGEELCRFGVHAERGEESIAHMLSLYAGHDRNHLAQVERILAGHEPGGAARAFPAAPIKPAIDHVVLEQLDVRAGTIRDAVPLAGADRLAVLTVAFADRERTIVAGIRTERPSLDAIVGRQCLFVVNLAPRTIRGQLSEGMLFDIGFADGLRPAFAQPEWPVPDGTRAG
ncbi:MAG TPA: DinB family protein [Vicinamibacterales bacterium]